MPSSWIPAQEQEFGPIISVIGSFLNLLLSNHVQ